MDVIASANTGRRKHEARGGRNERRARIPPGPGRPAATRPARAGPRGAGQEVRAEARGVDGELGAADWAAAARELQPHD